MKRYIQSFSTEYYYWIYPDKSKSSRSLYEGRANSLFQCQCMIDNYKKRYGSSCVITVKEMGLPNWICTRADKVL